MRTLAALLVLVAAAGALAWFTWGRDPGVVRYATAGVELDLGGLRYAYYPLAKFEELYDLTTDPGCTRDLAPERPADVERMRGELEERLGLGDIHQLPGDHEKLREHLKGLGYF